VVGAREYVADLLTVEQSRDVLARSAVPQGGTGAMLGREIEPVGRNSRSFDSGGKVAHSTTLRVCDFIDFGIFAARKSFLFRVGF
jgi:hypothetical protein